MSYLNFLTHEIRKWNCRKCRWAPLSLAPVVGGVFSSALPIHPLNTCSVHCLSYISPCFWYSMAFLLLMRVNVKGTNKGEKGSIEGKRFISLEINTSLDRDNQTITKCFLVCCLYKPKSFVCLRQTRKCFKI